MKVANYGETSQKRREREQKMDEKLMPFERNFGRDSKIKEKKWKSGVNTYELEPWAKELGEKINGKQTHLPKEAAGEPFLQEKIINDYLVTWVKLTPCDESASPLHKGRRGMHWFWPGDCRTLIS